MPDHYLPTSPAYDGLLVVPRLRVQNCNCISSPLTWGFPSITAFTGLMWALERKLASLTKEDTPLFGAVGVVCHAFSPQTSSNGFTHSFHLTRNPFTKDGEAGPIVEEGRAHIDISLLFAVETDIVFKPHAEQQQLIDTICECIETMRIAGGSVLPMQRRPYFVALSSDSEEENMKEYRKLSRKLLPGFALVSRDDKLLEHLGELRKTEQNATALDAWLDLSRVNWRAHTEKVEDEKSGELTEKTEWKADKRDGWLVPIPVGYTAISDLYDNADVSSTRDSSTPFRFVESIYSMGQWIAPHRLKNADDILWFPFHNEERKTYRCYNSFNTLD